jgi:cell division septation protein DedD
MVSPDRSWVVVGFGLVFTAIVSALLGAMVTLWLVERPAPISPARPSATAAAPAPSALPAAAPPAIAPAAPTPAAPAPAAAPPAPAAASASTPTPAPAPSAPAAAPTPAVAPAPAAPASPPPAAPAAAAAAPPLDADAVAATLPYTVQLGVFVEAEGAQRLAKMLTDQGYPAQVEIRKTSKGREMHYVRLADGYDSMGEASSEAAMLKRKLDVDAIPLRRQMPGSGQ